MVGSEHESSSNISYPVFNQHPIWSDIQNITPRLLGEHLRPTALDFHVLLQLHVEDCVLHVPTEAAAEELEAMVVRPRNTCGSRVLCRFWLQLLAVPHKPAKPDSG